MPGKCPCCGSPQEDHINADAPFIMYLCGTRVWRKGAMNRVVQSPGCVLSRENRDIDHYQEEHRPRLPGEES